jgi:hypothetical protein
MPSAVTLPDQAANDGNITWPGQDAGFLGRGFDPWLLAGDPNAPAFDVEGLSLAKEVPTDRFEQRQTLRERMDSTFARLESAAGGYPASVRQAADLIASPAAKRAFNLSGESPKLRDRYGRTRFGQSCLLARRLVEAGVRLVCVNWPNDRQTFWDTHGNNFNGLKTRLMPPPTPPG